MVDDLFDVSDDGVVLRVHVHPGAGRTTVVGRHGDALKVKVAAPPQDGRANDAVRQVVADVFGVAVDDVEVTGGATGRAKRVRIGGVERDEAVRLLQLAVDGDARPGDDRPVRPR